MSQNLPKGDEGVRPEIIRVEVTGSIRTPRHATQPMLVSPVSSIESIERPAGHASSKSFKSSDHAGGGWYRSI